MKVYLTYALFFINFVGVTWFLGVMMDEQIILTNWISISFIIILVFTFIFLGSYKYFIFFFVGCISLVLGILSIYMDNFFLDQRGFLAFGRGISLWLILFGSLLSLLGWKNRRLI